MNFIKTISNTKHKKPFRAILPILILATLFLGSCLKDDDNNGYDSQTIVSAVASVNASPSMQGYDFYTDANTIVNTEQDFKYDNQIRYKRFYSGNREFVIFKAGTTSSPVLDSSLTIENGKFHTLFLAGPSDKLNFLLLNDGNLEKASSGKAKIRFVNLSPDGGELSLGIKDATALLASNKKFKEFSDFQETAAGSLKLDLTSSNGTVLKEITLVAQDGYLYTVYAKGFLSGNPDFKIDLNTLDHYSLAIGFLQN
ncbi:protein of unknown function [bacterium A37T11]|nr:protein of unknown function [bacterium A37T11]